MKLRHFPILALAITMLTGPVRAQEGQAGGSGAAVSRPLVPPGPEPQVAILFVGGLRGKIDPCQ